MVDAVSKAESALFVAKLKEELMKRTRRREEEGYALKTDSSPSRKGEQRRKEVMI